MDDRVIVDPQVAWGTPHLRDTGISVGRVIELTQTGLDNDEILERLPCLTTDDLHAAREWYEQFGPDGLRAQPPAPGSPRIIVDAALQGGQPTIAGTNIPVDVIIHLWEEGLDVEDILADFPDLKAEDIAAAIDYANLPY